MASHPAPLSLGFSSQEYWSGLPFPSPMHACVLSHFSHVWFCVTPWTVAHQTPLSMGFSREEYQSGLPSPPLSSWSNPCLLCLPALAGGYLPPVPPGKPRDQSQVSHIAVGFFISHKGSPRILEWIAYPFSSGSSQPRSRTRVSCIAGRFFTNWAIREALQLIPPIKAIP